MDNSITAVLYHSQRFEVISLTQPNKMVNYTKTICWPLTTNYFSVFDHFVRLVFKGLISKLLCLGTTGTFSL